MSKIAEQIEKLREQEKRLHRETRKVEFLTHILTSAREYEHADFKEVKADVVQMLDQFVAKTIEAIEAGTVVSITVGTAAQPVTIPQPTPVEPKISVQPQVEASAQTKSQELSPAEKLNFALDNRHLAGKKVSIENDKNLTITGTVVGLDAPNVVVKTETGPSIKVPLGKVSLV